MLVVARLGALHARLGLRLPRLPRRRRRVVRADPTRIAAQIVTGIGFLGAGAIIRQGLAVRGLTTAATLWVVAAIGLAAGAGYYAAAVITTADRRSSRSGRCASLAYRVIDARPAGGAARRRRARAGESRRASQLLGERLRRRAARRRRSSSEDEARPRAIVDAAPDRPASTRAVAVLSDLEYVLGVRWRRVSAALASANAHKAAELARVAARLGARAARRRRATRPRSGATLLRERARQGALRRGEVAPRGRVGARRGLGHRGRGARRRGRAIRSARWRRRRRASRRLLAALDGARASRRARYVCELVAIAPDGQRAARHGRRSRARIAEEPRGSGGLRLRPDLRPGRARSGRWPSSATTWKASTRTAPGRSASSAYVAGPDACSPRGSARRRPRHQLISAPKTITFAIT